MIDIHDHILTIFVLRAIFSPGQAEQAFFPGFCLVVLYARERKMTNGFMHRVVSQQHHRPAKCCIDRILKELVSENL